MSENYTIVIICLILINKADVENHIIKRKALDRISKKTK